MLRVRTEDYAEEPIATIDAVCAHLGLAFDAALPEAAQAATARIRLPEQWAVEAMSADKLAEARRLIRRLTQEDLAAYGYTVEEVWRPLDSVAGRRLPRVAPARLTSVRRHTVSRLRRATQRSSALGRIVRKVRLACDVLLRQ